MEKKYKLGLAYAYYGIRSYNYLYLNSFDELLEFYIRHENIFKGSSDVRKVDFWLLSPIEQKIYEPFMGELLDLAQVTIDRRILTVTNWQTKPINVLAELEAGYKIWERKQLIDELLEDLENE